MSPNIKDDLLEGAKVSTLGDFLVPFGVLCVGLVILHTLVRQVSVSEASKPPQVRAIDCSLPLNFNSPVASHDLFFKVCPA